MNPITSEKESRHWYRILTFFLAILGVYPQLIALRTIMMGLGLIDGDWKEDQKYNKKILYKIEPVVESLLQVRQFVTMLHFT